MISLSIDSSKGGNGDVWMRLVGFYAMATLLPEVEIRLKLSPVFHNLAPFVFGDRLKFESELTKTDLYYTHLGIKDLMPQLLKGQRFISPYQRAVAQDRKRNSLKDRLNLKLFDLADFMGVIQLPHRDFISKYQAYLDVIGIKKLRVIGYADLIEQVERDLPEIMNKLKSTKLPSSPELVLPDNLSKKVCVFPTGTGRQFVPVNWAKQYLPEAYYCFFHKDPDQEAYAQAGLKILPFYKEPGDIIKIAQTAHWAVSTDSFPSHLLQTATTRTTIALTVFKNGRTVSPAFRGKVIDSLAPCAPCIHLDKRNHPRCAAGFTECLNWKNPVYTDALLQSIPDLNL